MPRAATPVGPAPPRLIAAPAEPEDEATGELITPFQMLDRFVLPGTRQRLSWRPPDGIGRGELPSPITVIHGAKPGPVLCLIAGIHGDELNGIEVARRIGDEVDATRLNGTLVVAPIVNVFGFTRNNRYLPDRRDLNRHFPGSRSGSIASRLAHGFFNDVVRRCDALVDFHTGSFQRSNLPQIRADLTNPDVLEFTRGFGNTLVLHSPGSRGMLRLAAVGTGIPAVTFEVGAPHFLEEQHIAPAADAIRSLMHRMGLLASEAHAGEAPVTPIYQDSSWVRTNAGGFLFSEVQLGQQVKPGERLGHVVDPITSRRSEILAPFPGASSACRSTSRCCRGMPRSTSVASAVSNRPWWTPRRQRPDARRPARRTSAKTPRTVPTRSRAWKKNAKSRSGAIPGHALRANENPARGGVFVGTKAVDQKNTRSPAVRLRPISGATSLRKEVCRRASSSVRLLPCRYASQPKVCVSQW